MESSPLEALQERHRKEKRDLQGRITGKKKNATKKTRKGVNDECERLERELQERHAAEVAELQGPVDPPADAEEEAQDASAIQDADVADVADSLAASTVSDLGSEKAANGKSSEPTPDAHATQGQGKKRNRQKDRLARRAAAVEAEAEAAEAEVLTMTDYRAIESTAMRAEIEANQLTEHDIRPDGHCLFNAVADQLSHSGQYPTPPGAGEPTYKTVRAAAAMYMESHRDDFAPFLDEDFDSYVAKIRDTAEWGGQPELMALANTYNLEIRVVQNGKTQVFQPTAGPTDPSKLTTVWLAYYRHGFGLGEHYNSLRAAKA